MYPCFSARERPELIRRFARERYLELRKKAMVIQWDQIFLQEYCLLDEGQTGDDLRASLMTNPHYAEFQKKELTDQYKEFHLKVTDEFVQHEKREPFFIQAVMLADSYRDLAATLKLLKQRWETQLVQPDPTKFLILKPSEVNPSLLRVLVNNAPLLNFGHNTPYLTLSPIKLHAYRGQYEHVDLREGIFGSYLVVPGRRPSRPNTAASDASASQDTRNVVHCSTDHAGDASTTEVMAGTSSPRATTGQDYGQDPTSFMSPRPQSMQDQAARLASDMAAANLQGHGASPAMSAKTTTHGQPSTTQPQTQLPFSQAQQNATGAYYVPLSAQHSQPSSRAQGMGTGTPQARGYSSTAPGPNQGARAAPVYGMYKDWVKDQDLAPPTVTPRSSEAKAPAQQPSAPQGTSSQEAGFDAGMKTPKSDPKKVKEQRQQEVDRSYQADMDISFHSDTGTHRKTSTTVKEPASTTQYRSLSPPAQRATSTPKVMSPSVPSRMPPDLNPRRASIDQFIPARMSPFIPDGFRIPATWPPGWKKYDITGIQYPLLTDDYNRMFRIWERPPNYNRQIHICDYSHGRMVYDYDGKQLLLPATLPDLTVTEPTLSQLPGDPNTWLNGLARLVPRQGGVAQHWEQTFERDMFYYGCRTVPQYWAFIKDSKLFNDDQVDEYATRLGRYMVNWPPGMFNLGDVMWDEIDHTSQHQLLNATIIKVDRSQDINKVVDIMHEFYEMKDTDPNWAGNFIRQCEGDAEGTGGYFDTVLNRPYNVLRNILHMQPGGCTHQEKTWAYYSCLRQHVDAQVKTTNRQDLTNNVYPTSFQTKIQRMTKKALSIPVLLRDEVRQNPWMFPAELTAYLQAQWKQKGAYSSNTFSESFDTYIDPRLQHAQQPPELYNWDPFSVSFEGPWGPAAGYRFVSFNHVWYRPLNFIVVNALLYMAGLGRERATRKFAKFMAELNRQEAMPQQTALTLAMLKTVMQKDTMSDLCHLTREGPDGELSYIQYLCTTAILDVCDQNPQAAMYNMAIPPNHMVRIPHDSQSLVCQSLLTNNLRDKCARLVRDILCAQQQPEMLGYTLWTRSVVGERMSGNVITHFSEAQTIIAGQWVHYRKKTTCPPGNYQVYTPQRANYRTAFVFSRFVRSQLGRLRNRRHWENPFRVPRGRKNDPNTGHATDTSQGYAESEHDPTLEYEQQPAGEPGPSNEPAQQRARVIYEPLPALDETVYLPPQIDEPTARSLLNGHYGPNWERTHTLLDANVLFGCFIFRHQKGNPSTQNIVYIERTEDDLRKKLDSKRQAAATPD